MQSLPPSDLIPESRLRRIEERIRQKHPELPENAVFLATYQPEQVIPYGEKQVPVPIAALAQFSIFVPHPKYPERPGYGYMPIGRMFYRQQDADLHKVIAWQTLDNEYRHNGNVEADPAFQAFMLGPVKAALDWFANVKDLIVKKVPDGASG